MKKFLLSLLSMVILSSAYSYADVITLNGSDFPAGCTLTSGKKEFTYTPANGSAIGFTVGGYASSNHQMRGNKSAINESPNKETNFYFYNTTGIENIEKIVITASSTTLHGAKTHCFEGDAQQTTTALTDGITGEESSTTVATYTLSGTKPFFRINFANGSTKGTVCLSKIEITYTPNTNPNAPKAPEITCENNTVTITNNEEGASVYYTTDGTTVPDATSTLYEAPFTITETCTVKAIAIKNGESSNVATHTCEYVATYATIQALIDAGEGAKGIVNGPITAYYQNGSELFVKDAGGYYLLYGTNSTTIENGATFASIQGTAGKHNTGWPMHIIDYTLGEQTQGTPVEPEIVEVANIASVPDCAYVKLIGVTVDPTAETFTQNGNQVSFYNQFHATIPTDDLNYDVIGIRYSYNGKVQIQPISFEVSTEKPAEPEAVTSNPAAVNDIITVVRGTEISFTSAHAAKLKVVIEVDNQAAQTTDVEGNTYTYAATQPAMITITPYNSNNELITNLEALFMIEFEAAPLCGEIVFNPASGSEITIGSEVTISCENAAKITYTISTGGTASDPVTVDGNEAKVTVTEACTIEAEAENADGVKTTQTYEASYTVVAAPVTGSYKFDFGNAETANLAGISAPGSSEVIIVDKTFVSDPISIHFAQPSGTDSKWWSDMNIRLYTGGEMTVSVPDGYKLTSIVFTQETGETRWGMTADKGTLTGKEWTSASAARATGDEITSVEFTANSQSRFKTVTVNYEQTSTGVGSIAVDDENAPVEYYNMQGIRVENPAAGLYIRRQGNTASKVFIR